MKSERMWVLLNGKAIIAIYDRRSSCISEAERIHNQTPWRYLRKNLGYSVVRCTVTYWTA